MAATSELKELREQLARKLVKALEECDLSSIEDILSNGADPNLLLEPEGIAAMHLFLGSDDADSLTLTRLLLSHGGNPNVRSCDGLTPLHVCSAWGKVDVMRLLLKYGGDPNLRDLDGNTVVSLALDNGHLEVIDVLYTHCDNYCNPKTRLGRHIVDAMGDGLPRDSHRSSTTSSMITGAASESADLNLAFVSAESAVPTLTNNSTETLPRDQQHDSAEGCLENSSPDTLNVAYLSAVSSELNSCCTYCTVDEFLFVDSSENVALLERQYLPNNDLKDGGDCRSSSSSSLSSYQGSSSVLSDAESVPTSLKDLPDDVIFQKLKSLGEIPGPLTPSTRRVYLRRLHCLQNGRQPLVSTPMLKKELIHSPQLAACLTGRLSVESYRNLEMSFFAEFSQPMPHVGYRGGAVKSCFNYLLLDPRVSQNLPQKASTFSDSEALLIFVNAVFYVGKGQQTRAYDHFYEALRSSSASVRISHKVKRIQEIWRDGFGVISLHCFQGTIAAEAFTREACLIDAIGKTNLTNERVGNYYGQVAKWLLRDKCRLGSVLLHRALCIFLQEGERQIYPFNLATPKSSCKANKR